MEFIPNTAEQQKEMLESIGLTMADLFGDVPPELMAKSFNLPHGLSEQEVRERLAELAGKNSIDLTLFLGGGFYDHFIPSAVYSIISRSEFYTAYTPYQPEISQGTLQAIYEYQSADLPADGHGGVQRLALRRRDRLVRGHDDGAADHRPQQGHRRTTASIRSIA